MQRLASRITVTAKVSSSLRTIILKETPSSSSSSWLSIRCFSAFSSQQRVKNPEKEAIPGDLLKWGFTRFLQDFEICIWCHLGRGHIGLTMKAKLYRLLEQRGSDCRYFVIPLWRGSGYTTMFAQVQLPYMLFTGLEDYKARGTQASPYFTASFYTEFAESKDLVLIRGDIVFTSKLTDEEAKWLLEITQSFYLNDVRYKLVECFNKEASDFEFNKNSITNL
ncbi:hypothetical protein Goshw_005367 [Gossypium schwendimanii]|uniref:ATP synthase mitochondrial F1 complex assembly factor 1 n=1 Tax=Gossypium schwendimanii TaxID=34291 RepID=A0A7J9M0R8_GOSSC|nr:hypothetical protein [Gossypium schwendimanii]